jgi:hypothetical protein
MLESINDTSRAYCTLCASVLAYGGSTGHLDNHLQSVHPEAKARHFAKLRRSDELMREKMHLFLQAKDTMYWTTRWIIATGQPFNVVNDPYFRDLMMSFNPNKAFTCDRKTVVSRVDNLADAVKERVSKTLLLLLFLILQTKVKTLL